ncbi:MAG: type II toxin-antitoxin system VapC family toxin [Betaproteobacteria bacterium]
MKYLLDTHLLLWAAAGMPALPLPAKKLIEDPTNDIFFSAASLWEISIKHGLGRADFQVDPQVLRRALFDNGYQEIVVSSLHAAATATLPPIHKDPFDRMLVAQAIAEGITLLTCDNEVAQYKGPIKKFKVAKRR